MGIALFENGDKREAGRITLQALELCRSRGDEEGVRAYTKNLETIGTYDLPAREGIGANATVRIRNEEGRTLTLDELRTAQGRLKFDVSLDGNASPEANQLHQDGRAAGERGDHDTAQSLLTKAAEIAPTWPYPIYDRAFSYLLQHKFDLALRDYQRTLELAPDGFFTAEVAVDTLTRESAGELRVGFYAAFAMLEHMPKEQRASIVRQLVELLPSYAPSWNEHAQFVDDPRERLDVIQRGLAASPDRHTRGSLLVKKAHAMHSLGDPLAAMQLLQDLASDPTESLYTRALAEFDRARFSKTAAE
jgi:tetratricopeptide (TPR) repeat protein